MYKYYEQLKGQRIIGIVKDPLDDEMWGLLLGNNKIAWIMRDPEGNGGGFLHITDYE